MVELRTERLKISRSRADKRKLAISLTIDTLNDVKIYTEIISIKALRDFIKKLDVKDKEGREVRELIERVEY